MFNRVGAETFPHQENISVFFSLTNGRGQVEVTLQIEQDDGEALVKIRGQHNIPGPLTILDHGVQLKKATFKKPGRHWATVWCGGELLNRRPFDVVPMQPQQPPGGAPPDVTEA